MSATPETNTNAASSAGSGPTVGSASTESSSEGSHIHRRRSRRSRRRHTIFFDLTETSDPRFDRIIEVLLIVLLIFAPLALGAVQAWSEMVVILIAATMALVLGCKLIARPDIRVIWSWSYAPIAIFIALTALQVTPLPMSIVRVLSPGTAALKTSLLTSVTGTERNLLTTTLSMYPEATWHDLRLLLAIAVVYVVTLNVVRRQKQIERILAAVALIGAIVALVGFTHLAFGITQVYGIVGRLPESWPIAPFINRNHFGQFMNLSLGAALGLLLVHGEQMLKSQRKQAIGDDHSLPQISGAVLAIAGAIVLMGVGVCLSLSRGAMISMTVAGMFAVLVAQRQGMSTRIWMLALPLLAAAMVVVWFGFEVIFGRFAQALEGGDASVGGRLEIVRDTIEGWRQFAVLGSGLGTFQVVFPMLDRSNITNLATHAENEYAQTLLEAGAAGLAMVAWFLGIVWIRFVRAMKSAPSPMASVATGLGFGLLAILLQSFSDFGQHAPANAILTAVGCAMLVTLAEAGARTKPADHTDYHGNRLVRVSAMVASALVILPLAAQAYECAMAQKHWYVAREFDERLEGRDWRGSDQEYINLLQAADAALQWRPLDIQYHYWLNFYRWKVNSRDRDPETGQIRFQEKQLEYADRIATQLLRGAALCPTFGPTYLLAGQIQKNVLGKADEGTVLIRTALRLSRADPGANFEVAMLDASAGDWNAAMQKLRHAADLVPSYRNESVVALTRNLHRTDLAIELAGESVPAVRSIVKALETTGDPAAGTAARDRLELLIEQRGARPDARDYELIDAAELYVTRKQYAEAIKAYRRALQINSTNARWYLELAKSLAADGKPQEALEQAHQAERLGAGGAQNLIIQLRLDPTSVPAR